jgi:hypothetical protein
MKCAALSACLLFSAAAQAQLPRCTLVVTESREYPTALADHVIYSAVRCAMVNAPTAPQENRSFEVQVGQQDMACERTNHLGRTLPDGRIDWRRGQLAPAVLAYYDAFAPGTFEDFALGSGFVATATADAPDYHTRKEMGILRVGEEWMMVVSGEATPSDIAVFTVIPAPGGGKANSIYFMVNCE